MIKPLIAAFVGALLFGSITAAQPAVVEGPPPFAHFARGGGVSLSDPATIEPFLDGYVAAAMADQYPPGMIVAVATKDRVFVKAYGVADMETGARATPETLFRIASISKTFVWTAVAMLADEGKLNLNADVNDFLREFRLPDAFGKPVTLNDLMAHRPGFEDTLGDFFQSGKGRSFAEALKKTRPRRVAPPGERTAYSNWGTDLAAFIVEEVTGMAFDRFVSERILAPLGMVSTVQHDHASVATKALNNAALDARMAKPHKLESGASVVIRHDALDPMYPAGGMALDAHDAGRWLQFFLNDGVVFNEDDGSRRLISPQSFTMMRLRAFNDRLDAPDFAHGFMETEIGGARTFGHGGTLTGFISDMTVAPSLGVGVFVVVNGAEGGRLPDLVSRFVIEKFANADSYPSRWQVKADDKMLAAAKSVEGAYQPNRRVYSRLEKFSSLGGDLTIAAEDDGSLVLSTGGKEKRYYPLKEGLWTDRSRDRLFAYRDSKGAISRIAIQAGTTTADRVAFLASSNGLNAGVGVIALMSLLAFLGAWRRQGRVVVTTDFGVRLAILHLAVAGLWFVFIGSLIGISVVVGGKELPDLQEGGWPPLALILFVIVAHIAAIGALAAAAGSVPVLFGSGWSLWRRAHYVLFAVAGLFAVYELFVWRLILAPWSG